MVVKRYEMKMDSPVDVDAGARVLGGNVDMFMNLLEKYEGMGLMKNIEDLSRAYDAARENPSVETYEVVKNEIHMMKGSSSYCGGARITDDCYWM